MSNAAKTISAVVVGLATIVGLIVTKDAQCLFALLVILLLWKDDIF